MACPDWVERSQLNWHFPNWLIISQPNVPRTCISTTPRITSASWEFNASSLHKKLVHQWKGEIFNHRMSSKGITTSSMIHATSMFYVKNREHSNFVSKYLKIWSNTLTLNPHWRYWEHIENKRPCNLLGISECEAFWIQSVCLLQHFHVRMVQLNIS